MTQLRQNTGKWHADLMSSVSNLVSGSTIHTPRLTLRPICRGDDAFLRRLLTHATVRAYLGGIVDDAAIPRHLDCYHTEAQSAPYWTVLWLMQPVGLISLTPHKDGSEIELSYQFLPEAAGHGLAFEATRAVLDHAIASGLPRIIAETQAANVRSVNLLNRLGMQPQRQIDRFGARQIIYAT